MPNRFFKNGNVWLAQQDGYDQVKYHNKGEYTLIVDGNLISVVGKQSGMIPIFHNVRVTTIQKDLAGNYYASVPDFIAATGNFFEIDYLGGCLDTAGRSSTNTVFGDSITATRYSYVAAQFQYGLQDKDKKEVIQNGATIDIVNSMLQISTGIDPAAFASIKSTDTVRYVPGQEIYCYFTCIFDTPQPDSFQRVGLFDENDGFFIGYEGEDFVFSRRRSGVHTNMPIDIEEYSTRKQYALNPQKGNIYKISYGYLGFAPITLEVMTPTGELSVLARIEYPNNYEETHTTQTFLPVRGEIGNTGNTVNLTMKSGSIAAGMVNSHIDESSTGRQFSWKNDSAIIVDGNTCLVVFRNKENFSQRINYVSARLLYTSGANSTNKNAKWRIYKDPTFTNTPTWNDVNTADSIIEYSLDATIDFTVLNELILAWNTAKESSFREDVSDYILDLRPGQMAAFVIESGTLTGEADISIRWNERF